MSAFDQSSYQVRFDWGLDGLARLAPADVIVVVDVLRFSTAVTAAVEAGNAVALRAELSRNGAPISVAAGAHAERGATILLGCLRNRAAVADAIVREQHERGGRVSVAIIAAGERAPRHAPEPMRFGTLGLGLGQGLVQARRRSRPRRASGTRPRAPSAPSPSTTTPRLGSRSKTCSARARSLTR